MVITKPKPAEFIGSVGNESNPSENFTTTVNSTEDERGSSLEKWVLDLFKVGVSSFDYLK